MSRQPNEGLEQLLEKVREKYRLERDRRIRPEGESQYIEATGSLARYTTTDPYVEKRLERDPVTRHATVVIIGGGWAGALMTGTRLRNEGIDFVIIEDGADFGGTWYWNRYPGAQCDIDSYCYIPLLEETGYVPKDKYSYADELFAHSQLVGRKWKLYEDTLFQTAVTGLNWDDAAKVWRVQTDRNDAITGKFVVFASGPLSRGKLPGLPGLEKFKGHSFHTSRWDFKYTGGDNRGNLHKLADKRVAIIGTGATAVQSIPYLGMHAKHLYVFQRTPSTVGARRSRKTDPNWFASLKPGWQEARQANLDALYVGDPVETDLVDDELTRVFKAMHPRKEGATPEELSHIAELADLELMEERRALISRVVKDPATAEALKPWYRILCKRPCFNDEYLETFTRPNVTLIDTTGSKGVERATENGVVEGGVEYEVDCIIFATGFENGTNWKRRFGIGIHGENGMSLYDHWAHGMRTMHGTMIRHFPNFFYVGPGQGGYGFNFTTMAQIQVMQLVSIVREAQARGWAAVQPSAKGEADWLATVKAFSGKGESFLKECTPGYYNAEGRPDVAKYDLYMPGVNALRKLIQEWTAEGNLKGLEATRA